MTAIKQWALCACSLFALTLCAAEKSWTGGAGNTLFSAAANWNPAGAPEDGDALLFANSSAINVTNDIVGRTFSGITASGSGAVTLQAGGSGFTLGGNINVFGSGVLNIAVPITLNTASTFNLTNASLYVYSAISGSGSITIEGGKSFYAKDAVTLGGGVIANKGKLYIEKTSFTAPVTLNQLLSNGVSYVALSFLTSGTYAVPITFSKADGYANGGTLSTPSGVTVTNTAPVTLAPSSYTRWQPDGSMTFAGGIILQTPVYTTDIMSIVFNGNSVIRTVPINFPNWLHFDSGTLRLAVAGNTYAGLKCYTKTMFTDVPYALDPDKTVNFGTGYSKNGALDLNGNDQVINRPVLDTQANIDTSSYLFTSSTKPATLTCRATASTTFFGSIDGSLSLSWAPVSGASTLTITGRTSQTTGALCVNAGTLRLAGGSAFPNLSVLCATNTGLLRVETSAVNVSHALTLADTAQLSLPVGLTLTCLTANVDGLVLTAGVYSAASTVNGRAFIADGGTLAVLAVPLSGTVRTWTGSGADNRFSTVENWDSAPTFDGSETLLFASAGKTGVVDGVVHAGALRFSRSSAFTFTSADAASALWLGLGGITALAPTVGALVTNTLSVPLELACASEWQVASNQTLAVSGRVSGGLPTLPLIKTGDGTLRLTGTNTFESPLVISNGFVNVNNGTALGNPTNTITIHRTTSTSDSFNQRGPLYFTDTFATNNRPLIYGRAVGYIGQLFPLNATLVLNGKFTFLGNNGPRIDCQGTLIFKGGFDCSTVTPWMQTVSGGSRMMRFEEQPLNLGGNSISLDNYGTFNVFTTNNTWSSLGLFKGTFLCGAANVLPTNSFVTFGVSYALQGFLDLNGYDQRLQYITCNTTPLAVTNMFVRSAAPATLTLQGDSSTTRTFLGYFMNEASLRHRNTGTLAFTGRSSASTTTGDLRVEAGTVAFRTGATWKGSTNITVTAGTLSVEGGSGTTFGGNSTALNVTRLHLTSASHVNLADGVTDYVRAATLNGVHLPIGSYGSATSAAQYKSPLFTGNGLLHVLRSEALGTLITVY